MGSLEGVFDLLRDVHLVGWHYEGFTEVHLPLLSQAYIDVCYPVEVPEHPGELAAQRICLVFVYGGWRLVHEVYDGATGSPVPLGELGLVHPRELSRPVGVLSVGQQRRLALAILVARQPDLLLLDEPTNHISLTLADELEEALQRSTGTVIVASHDRWLRSRWDGPTLAL